MSFPMRGPSLDQFPSVSVFRRSRFTLALIMFHHVDHASETGECILWEHIKVFSFWDVREREVKVACLIWLALHDQTIRLCPTIIDHVVARLLIKPCVLHLHSDEHTPYLEDHVIRMTVPTRAKNTPTSSEGLQNRCLFSNISLEFGIHVRKEMIGALEPGELPGCSTPRY